MLQIHFKKKATQHHRIKRISKRFRKEYKRLQLKSLVEDNDNNYDE